MDNVKIKQHRAGRICWASTGEDEGHKDEVQVQAEPVTSSQD